MTEFEEHPQEPQEGESQEIIITPEMLPTTPEIVSNGVVDFSELLAQLPEGTLKRRFLLVPDIANVFLGISPEAGGWTKNIFQDVPDKEFEELSSLLANTRNSVRLLQSENDNEYLNRSLLNLAAAEHVVHSNPDYFPMAQTNPKEWLMQNYNQWHPKNFDISTGRYGLLSGYPVWDVDAFPLFQFINDMVELHVTDREDRIFYKIYKDSLDMKSVDNNLRAAKIVRTVIPDLDDDSVSVLYDSHLTSTQSGCSFRGFFPEWDEQYIRQIDEYYNASGIKQEISKYSID